ncbi:MAG: hypothetical protein ACTSQJ_14295 [Promethearchaeota archaeon]
MEKKDKDIYKLLKLLKHWADHNNTHKESFIKWREIARNKSLSFVVENLDLAIKMMDKSTEYLLDAYQGLKRKINEM